MQRLKGVILGAMIIFLVQDASAQLKRTQTEEPSVSSAFIHPPTASDWFGFFNPENFQMRQSYSMSYSTFGRNGLALGTYTNSMLYRFSEKVDARVDISLQHSPYSTFDSKVQNSLNGIYLNRAELNYRPADNMLLRISYQQLPFGFYRYSPLYRNVFSGLDYYEGY